MASFPSANTDYDALLEEARRTDLSDIAKLDFLRLIGSDEDGRPVVAMFACRLPLRGLDPHRVLLYFVASMDAVTAREDGYIMVYFHSRFAVQNQPEYGWLRHVYSILPRKYKKNLASLFIVHPTTWMRMAFTFLAPFLSDKFWNKLVYINTLAELWDYFDEQQFGMPEEIAEFDNKVEHEQVYKLSFAEFFYSGADYVRNVASVFYPGQVP